MWRTYICDNLILTWRLQISSLTYLLTDIRQTGKCKQQYTISRCAKNSNILGYRRWPNMSRVVNKRLCVVKKTFRKIFGIDWLWLDFNSNTNRTKIINTDDLYYIKFHTQRFVYRSWHDLIRHRDIMYNTACTELCETVQLQHSIPLMNIKKFLQLNWPRLSQAEQPSVARRRLQQVYEQLPATCRHLTPPPPVPPASERPLKTHQCLTNCTSHIVHIITIHPYTANSHSTRHIGKQRV